MTPEEKHLWHDFLKYLPCTVNRQKMVGNYILDFYIGDNVRLGIGIPKEKVHAQPHPPLRGPPSPTGEGLLKPFF